MRILPNIGNDINLRPEIQTRPSFGILKEEI